MSHFALNKTFYQLFMGCLFFCLHQKGLCCANRSRFLAGIPQWKFYGLGPGSSLDPQLFLGKDWLSSVASKENDALHLLLVSFKLQNSLLHSKRVLGTKIVHLVCVLPSLCLGCLYGDQRFFLFFKMPRRAQGPVLKELKKK